MVAVELLAIVSAGDWTAVMVALTVGDVAVPSVADAILTTDPASMSAWVIV